MNQTTQEQIIIMSLTPLFEEAEAKGLWFYHNSDESGEVWCSPPYLKGKHQEGEYIWPPEQWQLRDPLIYMHQLHENLSTLVEEYCLMAKRLKMEQILELHAVSTNPAELL